MGVAEAFFRIFCVFFCFYNNRLYSPAQLVKAFTLSSDLMNKTQGHGHRPLNSCVSAADLVKFSKVSAIAHNLTTVLNSERPPQRVPRDTPTV